MPSLVPGLENTIGALFSGLVAATFLEGVLTTQVYIYFNDCQKDRISLRSLVGAVWVLDSIHLIVLCSMVYTYTVTNWGYPPALSDSTWGFNISVFLTSVIACTIQMFFAWRTWMLTRSLLLTALIIALSLTSVGAGFACGVLTFILVQFTEFVKYRWLVSLWLATSAGCDILIAGTLSWTLWKSRTGFKSTDTILTRLIVWTLNTGLLTSIIAVLDIIFFDNVDNLIYFAFNMILGKLYANMFVATLNRRESNRKAFDDDRFSMSGGGTGSGGGLRFERETIGTGRWNTTGTMMSSFNWKGTTTSPTTPPRTPKRVSGLSVFIQREREVRAEGGGDGEMGVPVPLVDMGPSPTDTESTRKGESLIRSLEPALMDGKRDHDSDV